MLAPGFSLRQTGALAMTPQLQQAIGLLQRSNQELLQELQTEALANPLLIVETTSTETDLPQESIEDRGDDLPEGISFEATENDEFETGAPDELHCPEPVRRATILDTLTEQWHLTKFSPVERLIGSRLLDLLDEVGRLSSPPAQLAAELNVALDTVEHVRHIMMQFTPVGCFATDLAECLAAQFRAANRYDPAVAALLRHLDVLARRDDEHLRRLCGVDSGDLAEMLHELRAMDPKPGYDPDRTIETVIPDVIVTLRDGVFVAELNPDTHPRAKIDKALHARLLRGDREARLYAKERLTHASWLVRAMTQRAESILLVTGEILRQQADFLHEGVRALRPLTLRKVAEATGLHESTVSRVSATRHIGTPRGVFAMKAFFSTALGTDDDNAHSAASIQHRIRQMIDQEDANAVLSDDAITERLQQDGVNIMRRTVAKYREGLGLPNSARRRREKKPR